MKAVSCPDKGHADLLEKYGFDIENLYRIAGTFLTEKAEKAFHLTFDDRIILSALSLHIKYGKYNPSAVNQPGMLDIFGRRRMASWESLGEIEPNEAKKEFVMQINRLCPLFQFYVEACYRNSNDVSQWSTKREHSTCTLQTQTFPVVNGHHFVLQNEGAIRTALNAQFREQFEVYAAQQYPSNSVKQAELISHLQDRHFHEYVSYVQQQYDAAILEEDSSGEVRTEEIGELPCNNEQNITLEGDEVASHKDPMNSTTAAFQHALSEKHTIEPSTVDDRPSLEASESGLHHNSPNQVELDCTTDSPNSQYFRRVPNTWTREDHKEFKALLANTADSVIQIGSGEVITVRIPTYPSGTSIFWEFATDDFDIGFGLFFEWAPVETQPTDHSNKAGSDSTASINEKPDTPDTLVDELIPIGRLNSQQEVFCGSHLYPGNGTYLFKFDNSYSLWRQKTLYYRVFYTC